MYKGLVEVGVWDSSNFKEKFRWIRTAQETLKQQEEDLKNRTLIVTTKIVWNEKLNACHDFYLLKTLIGH